MDDFLDTFLDRTSIVADPSKNMPSAEGAFNGVPKKSDREVDIYTPLVRSLSS